MLAGRFKAGDFPYVVAVHAVSLDAAPLRRFGFEVNSMPANWHSRLERFFMVGLVAIYKPAGWNGAQRMRLHGWPREAWISAPHLLALYRRDVAGADR